MKITLSENSGFCPGVRRADNELKRLIEDNSSKIYTLGNLIHNRSYTEMLSSKGVTSIEIADVENIVRKNKDTNISVVIRTHGITRQNTDFLDNLSLTYKNLNVYDMTCPYVKRIHKIADENTNSNTAFILFCDKNHPEAKGILSYAHGVVFPVASLHEVKELKIGEKVPILCSQTTQNLVEFKKIKNFLKKLYTNLIFFDTICNVTEKRQKEAISLSKHSDAVIVVGGLDSANTNKLYELACQNCSSTYRIETKDDLEMGDIPQSVKEIGIIAGASTPDDIILEVIKQWKKN